MTEAEASTGEVMPPEQEIKITTEVTREEIIAIAVSREEERLTLEINEKRTKVRELEKERKGLLEGIKKATDTIIKEAIGDKVAAANKALADCGLSEVVSVSVSGTDWDAGKINYQVVNGGDRYGRDGNLKSVEVSEDNRFGSR